MKLLTVLLLILFSTMTFGATKKVHIGLASNFSELSTVSFNPYGGYFRNGVKLALEHNSKRLADKQIEIVLKEFDYGADDLNVLKNVKEADRSGVSAVIGYNYSSNALMAAPLHAKLKLPMLSPSASANRLSSFGRYIHLGSFSNQYMAQVLAKFTVEGLKSKKIVVIPAGNCAYCTDLADTFEKELSRFGGTVVKRVLVIQEDKNFELAAQSLKGLDFDAVFIPNQELTAARIILSLLEAGIKKPFLGADGWGNEGSEFFNVLKGRKFDGYSVTHWHPGLKTKSSIDFVSSYKGSFKNLPNDSSVLAYDFMNFLIEAILSTKTHDRESVEEALRKIKVFTGVTGKYLMSPNKAPQKDILILKTTEAGFAVDQSVSLHRGQR